MGCSYSSDGAIGGHGVSFVHVCSASRCCHCCVCGQCSEFYFCSDCGINGWWLLAVGYADDDGTNRIRRSFEVSVLYMRRMWRLMASTGKKNQAKCHTLNKTSCFDSGGIMYRWNGVLKKQNFRFFFAHLLPGSPGSRSRNSLLTSKYWLVLYNTYRAVPVLQ